MSGLNKQSYKKTVKRSLERGFSLIEMMIVVTIIGIISALAYPAYQDHVARAQITEAWNMIEIVRIRMWEYYSQHGTFPDNAQTGDNTTDDTGNKLYDLPAPAELGGRYVESVTVNSTGPLLVMPGGGHFTLQKPGNGVLVKMRSNAATHIAGQIFGLQMIISDASTIHWMCSKKESYGWWGITKEVPVNYGTVPTRLLPGSCRIRD